MKKNKKKVEYIDDGHTIYNMDGLSKYSVKKNNSVYIDKKDRKHLIIAGFKAYLPMLLVIIIGFTLAYILIWLWLK